MKQAESVLQDKSLPYIFGSNIPYCQCSQLSLQPPTCPKECGSLSSVVAALQWRKAQREQIAHKETISGISRNQPHQWHHSISPCSVDFRIPAVTWIHSSLVPKEMSQVFIHTYHTIIKPYNLSQSAMQFHKRVSNFKQGLKIPFHFHSCVIIAPGSPKSSSFPT